MNKKIKPNTEEKVITTYFFPQTTPVGYTNIERPKKENNDEIKSEYYLS